MDIDLHELIQGRLRGATTRYLANRVGLDEARAERALDTVVPAILAGFLRQASSTEGQARLGRLLDATDDSILDDLTGLLTGDTTDLVRLGGKLDDWLFDGRDEAVAAALGRSTGLDARTLEKLLQLVVPIVTAWLARHKREERLDERGMGDLLRGEASRLEAALPAEVEAALGLGAHAAPRRDSEPGRRAESRRDAPRRNEPRRDESRPTESRRPEKPRGAKPAKGKKRGCLLPLLLIGVVIFFAWKTCSKPRGPAQPGTPAEAPAPSTTERGSAPRSPTRQSAAEEAFVAAVRAVDRALTSASSLRDVREAVPVIERSASVLGELEGRMRSLTFKERKVIRDAAKALPPRMEKWMEQLARIPGAGDVVTPSLLAFGEALDDLATEGR